MQSRNGMARLASPLPTHPSSHLFLRVHPLPFSSPLQTVIPTNATRRERAARILSSARLAQTPTLSQQSKVFSGKKCWLVYVHSSSLPHSGGSITKVWKKTAIRNRGPYQLISSPVSLLKFTGLDLLAPHSALSEPLAASERGSPCFRISCAAFFFFFFENLKVFCTVLTGRPPLQQLPGI